MLWLLYFFIFSALIIITISINREKRIKEARQKIKKEFTESLNLDSFLQNRKRLVKHSKFLSSVSKNYYNLALIALVENNLELAETFLRKATHTSIYKNKIIEDILFTRGCYYHFTRRYGKASVCFIRAYQVKQNNISLINNYGIKIFDTGNFDTAMALFKKSIIFEEKKNDYAYLYLAKIHYNQGALDEAYKNYLKVNFMEISNKEASHVNTRLTEITMKLKEYKNCLKYCKTALRDDKNNLEVLDRMILVLAVLKKYKDALFELEKIFKHLSILHEEKESDIFNLRSFIIREDDFKANSIPVEKEYVNGVQKMIEHFEANRDIEFSKKIYSYFRDSSGFENIKKTNYEIDNSVIKNHYSNGSIEKELPNCQKVAIYLNTRNTQKLINTIRKLNKEFPNNISLKVIQIYAQMRSGIEQEMIDILVNSSYLENLIKLEHFELRFFVESTLFYLKDKSNALSRSEKTAECSNLLKLKKTSNLLNELGISQWECGYEEDAQKSFKLALEISRESSSPEAFNLKQILKKQSTTSSQSVNTYTSMDWETAKKLRGKGSYIEDIILPVTLLNVPESKTKKPKTNYKLSDYLSHDFCGRIG